MPTDPDKPKKKMGRPKGSGAKYDVNREVQVLRTRDIPELDHILDHPDDGRPTEYSVKIGSLICSLVADGLSLRTITKSSKEFPSMARIFEWLREHEDFAAQYAKAKEDAADAMAQDLQDITDDMSIPSDHKRIMVDTRKWILSKVKRRVYGDKVSTEITGADGGPVQVSQDITGIKDILDGVAHKKAEES